MDHTKVLRAHTTNPNTLPNKRFVIGIILIFQCTDESVDFANVVVGTCVTRKITLCNPTDCDVPYRLLLSQDEIENDEDKSVISKYQGWIIRDNKYQGWIIRDKYQGY